MIKMPQQVSGRRTTRVLGLLATAVLTVGFASTPAIGESPASNWDQSGDRQSPAGWQAQQAAQQQAAQWSDARQSGQWNARPTHQSADWANQRPAQSSQWNQASNAAGNVPAQWNETGTVAAGEGNNWTQPSAPAASTPDWSNGQSAPTEVQIIRFRRTDGGFQISGSIIFANVAQQSNPTTNWDTTQANGNQWQTSTQAANPAQWQSAAANQNPQWQNAAPTAAPQWQNTQQQPNWQPQQQSQSQWQQPTASAWQTQQSQPTWQNNQAQPAWQGAVSRQPTAQGPGTWANQTANQPTYQPVTPPQWQQQAAQPQHAPQWNSAQSTPSGFETYAAPGWQPNAAVLGTFSMSGDGWNPQPQSNPTFRILPQPAIRQSAPGQWANPQNQQNSTAGGDTGTTW